LEVALVCVREIAFMIDALGPIIIGTCSEFLRNFACEGVLTGGLVKMAVYAKMRFMH